MDAAGSNPVNLTNHESSDLGPAWSPDGEYIAFSSNRDGDSDIYVMDTDGGNLINLTNNSASDSGSAWSPNGQQMAFASDRSGNWEIYVLNLSGGSPINVSNHEEAEYNPAWSPDGTAIAFQSSRDSNAIDRIREIYMVDADGENLTRLTAHGHSANYPTWSPDGQWIAYSYGEEGQGEIRVANVDTQEYFTLGEAWSGGTTPAWMGSTTLSAGSVEIPTPDPTDLPQDTDEYETPMIRVPAGTYSIGGDPAQALELCQIFRDQCQIEWFYDEAPIHQVTLEAFFIDQTEVLNVDYARCVSAGVCAPPDQMGSATRTSYYDNPHFNIYPVIYVSWEDAAIYCEWRGARLPTEAEWEVAARGGLEGNPYPWGIEFPLCEAGVLWGASFDDGMSCGGADTQLMASFFPNALGIYDMAGNVLEWTADWYDVYPGGDPGISNEFGEIYRVARGGSWYTYGDALRVSIRFPASPTASFNHYGFRCAASP
jgi:formylglycine-generating enzyme required for sulfatase activity/tricorn protease-like protein